jgi:hypothetical protein
VPASAIEGGGGAKRTGETLKEREQAAREAALVQVLERQRSELTDRAAALESEATRLRQEAGRMQRSVAKKPGEEK